MPPISSVSPRDRWAFGGFRLDTGTRKLTRGSDEIALPSRAFDALIYLVRHRDRIVEKDELIKAVWTNAFVSDDSLVHCVSVLRRALQDDSEHPRFIATLPRRGYQFVCEVAEEASAPPATASEPERATDTPPHTPPAWGVLAGVSTRVQWGTALVVLGAVLAFLGRPLTSREIADATSGPVILAQLPPAGTVLGSAGALSPDGRSLAFIARDQGTGTSRLWVRTLDSQVLRLVEGTEGASRPFWSPDGTRLAYFAGDTLKVASLSGEPVRTVARLSVSPSGGSWSRNLILFGDVGTGLNAVDTDSGAVHPVTTMDPATDVAHAWPSFLPDGRHFLFAITSWNKARTGVWLGSLDPAEAPRRLLPRASPAVYVDSGHLLYIENDTLVAAPFDLAHGTVGGMATPVAQNVLLPRVSDGEAFSVARGFLSFRTGARAEQLVWFTRDGKRLGVVDGPTALRNPMVSPDGSLLLATGVPSRDPGLWLVDLKGNASTRLGPDGIGPVWSPDGHRIAFTTQGGLDIYTSSTVGRTDNKLLLHDAHRKVLQDWSPDGRFMVFSRSMGTQLDLWLLPVGDPGHARPLLTTAANERGAAISPDGRWLAYTSDESGQWEVYLQEFPGLGSKRVVSIGGGGGPYWRRDGRELFYLSPDRSLMSVDIKLGTSPAVSRPRVLFRAPTAGDASEARNHFIAATDGQSFLINVMEDSRERGAITVMINWKARLEAPRRDTVGARLRSRASRSLGLL